MGREELFYRDRDFLRLYFLALRQRDGEDAVFINSTDLVGFDVVRDRDRTAEGERLLGLSFRHRALARAGDGQGAVSHLDVDIFAVEARQFGADVGVVLVLVEVNGQSRGRRCAIEARERSFKQAVDFGLKARPRRTLKAEGRRGGAECGIAVTNESHDVFLLLGDWIVGAWIGWCAGIRTLQTTPCGDANCDGFEVCTAPLQLRWEI